jgi:molybdenum cofactor cytidylyltransferase
VITAVLLAAGASRRFGAPKLLQEVNGKALIRWSAEMLHGLGVSETIVVVPPEHDALRRVLTGLDVRFVVNPRARDGMGSSVACAVSAVRPDSDAVLLALGDQPLDRADVPRRVVDRYHAGDVRIVAPTYDGIQGHPVLFDRAVFEELQALSDDRGGRAVVNRDPGRVALIEVGGAMPVDVDTPADLARLREGAQYISPPSATTKLS